MIEAFALNSLMSGKNSDSDSVSDKQKKNLGVLLMVVLIWLILWVWALVRAIHCSSKTPDSRAIHLFFATGSPVLYLLFSYTVSGFAPAA